MNRDDQALSLSNRSLRSALAQCRADLAAARAQIEDIKRGNLLIAGALCDSQKELSESRAEIERLSGRRCDGCKWWDVDAPWNTINRPDGCGIKDEVFHGGSEYHYPPANHYCKSWEAKDEPRKSH